MWQMCPAGLLRSDTTKTRKILLRRGPIWQDPELIWGSAVSFGTSETKAHRIEPTRITSILGARKSRERKQWNDGLGLSGREFCLGSLRDACWVFRGASSLALVANSCQLIRDGSGGWYGQWGWPGWSRSTNTWLMPLNGSGSSPIMRRTGVLTLTPRGLSNLQETSVHR